MSTDSAATASPAFARLVAEDAVGHLVRRDGAMAAFGSESGAPRLDWVEAVPRALADPSALESVEAEARALWDRGIRHLIWAGMGGSVMAVRTLLDLGQADQGTIEILPLDSTDPAALNARVRQLAAAHGLELPVSESDPAALHTLLADVLLIGVSMGMTSEEPITHLSWFADLLDRANLAAADHLLVMTLPRSHLDRFAAQRGIPSRPLQLDGKSGTPGRMSAPATRVFLLPAALLLGGRPGALRRVLTRAWELHDAATALERPAAHPFVRLAATLADAAVAGACHLYLHLPPAWEALFPWIEQLLEESLGKGGKGIVLFRASQFNDAARSGGNSLGTAGSASAPTRGDNGQDRDEPEPSGARADGRDRRPATLRLVVTHKPGSTDMQEIHALRQPYLDAETLEGRLAALAASFLGWQIVVALYGYLNGITFVGQPAVERYKARAAALRDGGDPLGEAIRAATRIAEGPITLLAPAALAAVSPGATLAGALRELIAGSADRAPIPYLDLTLNGESSPLQLRIARAVGQLAERLAVPLKIRRAPAAYHATEQSEMDGPPALLSLRVLVLPGEPALLGRYDDTFLQAQAVGTWQAMGEAGRPCLLLLVDGADADAPGAIDRLFDRLEPLPQHAGRLSRPAAGSTR